MNNLNIQLILLTLICLSGFLVYAALALIGVIILMIFFVPRYGQTHMVVYIGLCSVLGSITVYIGS